MIKFFLKKIIISPEILFVFPILIILRLIEIKFNFSLIDIWKKININYMYILPPIFAISIKNISSAINMIKDVKYPNRKIEKIILRSDILEKIKYTNYISIGYTIISTIVLIFVTLSELYYSYNIFFYLFIWSIMILIMQFISLENAKANMHNIVRKYD